MMADEPPPYSPDPPYSLASEAVTIRCSISGLSVEIIEQIIIHACVVSEDGDYELDLSPSRSKRWFRRCHPLTLGGVCKFWRDYMWSTSVFWTTIIFRVHPDSVHHSQELLEDWLARAKGQPLSIMVDCPDFNFTGNRRIYLTLSLALLAHQAPQWRRIEVHLPLCWYEHLFPKTQGTVPSDSYPLLQQASLNFTSEMADDERVLDSSLPDFTRANSLQKLAFSRVHLRAQPIIGASASDHTPVTCTTLQNVFPKKLTSLILYNVDTTTSTNLLQFLFKRFTKLVHLTMINCQMHPAPPVQRKICSNLRALKISVTEVAGLHNLIPTKFIFPNLKALTVYGREKFLYSRYILPFLENSDCRLEKFELKCPIAMEYEYDLIQLLSNDTISSALKELCIEDMVCEDQQNSIHPEEKGLGSTFFEVLHPDSDPDYLPKLELFAYAGPLAVASIEFLEPFILRCQIRDKLQSTGDFQKSTSSTENQTSILRKVDIRAEQYISDCTISEYPDPQYIWEVFNMIDQGILSLKNNDGS
ncbi:hypothetical protein CPC08DRAFT_712483, partial [Agrocybe pediades]